MNNINLTFDEFVTLAQEYNVLTLYRETISDLDTPVSSYIKLKNNQPSFLLESVEGGEKLGRYSTIGINPVAKFSIKLGQSSFEQYNNTFELDIPAQDTVNNTFDTIQELLTQFKSPLNSNIGLIGALAYDTVRFIEPLPELKVEQNMPEACFVFSGDYIQFDHLKKKIKLGTTIYFKNDYSKEKLEELYNYGLEKINNLQELLSQNLDSNTEHFLSDELLYSQESIQNFEANYTKDEFINIVNNLKERIKAGDIFQIVPSQKFTQNISGKINSLYIYRLLRSLNPSPYLSLMDFGDIQLISSSPEVMVKSNITEDEYTAILRPIAGTYRRGQTDQEDKIKAEQLKQDTKEKAEHLMLVDLARNDLGRVAVPGTVRPNGELMFVERYSHVLHLVSEIICDVKPETSSIDLLKATFPAGTLTGAPKVKAMQILSQTENTPRGFYTGCCGYLGFDNTINTSMTIRTIIANYNSQTNTTDIQLQAGAGVVYDSVPESEYQETINKIAALLKVTES